MQEKDHAQLEPVEKGETKAEEIFQEVEKEGEKQWKSLENRLQQVEQELSSNYQKLEGKLQELADQLTPVQLVEASIPTIPVSVKGEEGQKRKSLLRRVWSG